MAPRSASVCQGLGRHWPLAEVFAEPQSEAKIRLQRWAYAASARSGSNERKGGKWLKKADGLGLFSCIPGGGSVEARLAAMAWCGSRLSVPIPDAG